MHPVVIFINFFSYRKTAVVKIYIFIWEGWQLKKGNYFLIWFT